MGLSMRSSLPIGMLLTMLKLFASTHVAQRLDAHLQLCCAKLNEHQQCCHIPAKVMCVHLDSGAAPDAFEIEQRERRDSGDKHSALWRVRGVGGDAEYKARLDEFESQRELKCESGLNSDL